MKLLTIGSDRKIFEDNSSVLKRALEYAKRVEEYHVIIFSEKKNNCEPKKIGNVFLYPTNSLSRWLYVLDGYWLGVKIIRSSFIRGSSVISAQTFESGFLGVLLKKRFRFPLQIQVHTDFFNANFKKSFLNILRLLISSFVLKNADNIRVVSEEIAEKIKKKFPDLSSRVFVLPVWVDIGRLSQPTGHKIEQKEFFRFKFIILMVCRLSPEKKLETALLAVSRLVARDPFIGLIIAGDGPQKTDLQKMANNLGISNNVVFLGWQNDPTHLYKIANVFLSTSEYEGYGVSLIEAAASGCPIITTEVGIAKQICKNEENSFVCKIGDDLCFAESIYKLVGNEGLRHQFSQKMSQDISKISMSFSDYAEKYVDSLKKLVPFDTFLKKHD